MSGSFLIIGGRQEERRQKALQIVNDFSVSSLDTFFLESPTSLGINHVRDLKQQLCLKPYNSPFKSTIILEAEKLTIEAQNALLKTLEEPPENTILVLGAPNLEIFLPTVVSRCRIIELSPKSEIELTEEEFQKHLSSIISYLSASVGERLKLAQEVAQSREETIKWLNLQTAVYRRAMLEKIQAHGQLSNLTTKQLLTIFSEIEKTKEKILANVNPRFALECFLLGCLFEKIH